MFYLCFSEEEKEIIEAENKMDPRLKGVHEGGKWYRIGRGYKTYEELFNGEQILDKPCVVCGHMIESRYHNRASLVSKNMCFSCNLWDDRVKELLQPNKMVVDGYFYSLASESDTSPFKGFGGRRFVFQRLANGEIVNSTNVWGGGKVPKVWREKFPDNAKII
jgi:hypothetical protein